MTTKHFKASGMVMVPRDTLKTLHSICMKEGYELNCIVALAGAILGPSLDQASSDGDPDFKSDDNAVEIFAKLMAHKMAKSAAKGRSGWQDCSQEDLSRMLRDHVEKGDPVDVANFCMMLSANGYGISKSPAVCGEPEILAVVTLGGYFSCDELGDIDIEPQMHSLERIQQEVVRSDSDEYIELIDRAHAAQLQAEVSRLNYKSELYDEVWQKARDMGFMNVTMALDATAKHRTPQNS